ncbi:transposase [Bradyrhizobium sp. LB13.1]
MITPPRQTFANGTRTSLTDVPIGVELCRADIGYAIVVSLKGQVMRFFEKLPACLVAMEACGSAHYCAREIAALGHEVRLIPPAYVKPFVKRGKSDGADAEAVNEAVTRKTMRFVPIKTAEPSRLATSPPGWD